MIPDRKPDKAGPGPARAPSEMRFLDVHVEPWPDGDKVRVHIELTPFTEHPNLDVSILDKDESEVSNVSIIETMVRKMVFTMHLRTPQKSGRFTLVAKLVYPSVEPVDEKHIEFELPAQS